MRRITIFLLGLFFLLPGMQAQAIEVTTSTGLATTAAAFIQSANYSNLAYAGNGAAIGVYTNTSGLWGIGGGMVLSSGKVTDYSDGWNTSESMGTDFNGAGSARVDAYLTALGTPGTSHDAAAFSFDYTPGADTISFDFIFGSEEYPEYVGSAYNDIFGVWVTDALGATQQIVFDQFGNPVTINSAWMGVNPGTQLDGVSQLLSTSLNVVAGDVYTFEFIIADVADHIYDSTVYLSNFREYNSGGTGGPVTNPVATPEPSTFLLLGAGLLGLLGLGRRRFRS